MNVYSPVITADLSITLYNASYDENYHCVYEGALTESLSKHVRPALAFLQAIDKEHITILDLCFGLGYNTLASLHELKRLGFKGKVRIYSPEHDINLLEKWTSLSYPKEFRPFLHVLQALQTSHYFNADDVCIKLFLGDAKQYLKNLLESHVSFDIIYQDPFSPPKNPELWDMQHFQYIQALLKPNGILTTYSQSSRALFKAHRCGLFVYKCTNMHGRNFSICTKNALTQHNYDFKPVVFNWQHKLNCNPYLGL